jgi:hypothetical protein
MSQNGVPPESGGLALWRVNDRFNLVDEALDEYLIQRPWTATAWVGVRFPADDPDPGRWYRGGKT